LAIGIREISLTGSLALLAASLENFHKDPADRFIVAGALSEKARLVTADQAILSWPGQLVRIDAKT